MTQAIPENQPAKPENVTRRVIITGGPGTGKTSLLQEISSLGYPYHKEIARAVIRQQLELKTNFLPWEDLSGFSRLVFKGQLQQYQQAIEGKINFYDRGIPDVLAYLRKDGIHEEMLEDQAPRYPYNDPIFLTPPWPEIYGQDDERREDLQTMLQIHDSLKAVYLDLGYRVLEVPKLSITDRIQFIFDHLDYGG